MKTKVEVARMKNIIRMAWDFTGMQRVFQKKSGPIVWNLLKKLLDKIELDPYNFSHEKLCRQIQRSIQTTRKGTRKEREPSYGQAAKVVDVAMKVLVGYCRLPDKRTARLIAPRLHAGIDNKILKNHLKVKGIASLREINKARYEKLQSRLSKEAKDKGCSPIEYDDWLWRKSNVGRPSRMGKKTRPMARKTCLMIKDERRRG